MHSIGLLVLLVALLLSGAEALQRPSRLLSGRSTSKGNQGGLSVMVGADETVVFQTLYLEQEVDHFGFLPIFGGSSSNSTFLQKYLVFDEYFTKKTKADGEKGDRPPIFFYCGNEGDITLFAQNTGFMLEAAKEQHALVVFAEHRYYGESMPFGNESYASHEHLSYLTAEQALGDYSILVEYLQTTYNKGVDSLEGNRPPSPVIAFGGSYGGMLAAWFRMKYSYRVTGAIASSAPVLQFPGLVDPYSFANVATETFRSSDKVKGPQCVQAINSSWVALEHLARSPAGQAQINEALAICDNAVKSKKVITNVLNPWLSSLYISLTMVDYPYAANFLAPLPAWPVKEACSKFSDSTDVAETLRSIRGVMDLYFNYTNTASSCYNISGFDYGDVSVDGWDYQACTEMILPIATGGPHDMFYAAPFSLDELTGLCQDTYGVTPRPSWIPSYYGGKDLSGHTNIVFSNGNLDPWSAGGVLEDSGADESIVVLRVKGGAHHLDLRGSHKLDPDSVVKVRNIERSLIADWVEKYYRPPPSCPSSSNTSESISGAVYFLALIPLGAAVFYVFYKKWKADDDSNRHAIAQELWDDDL